MSAKRKEQNEYSLIISYTSGRPTCQPRKWKKDTKDEVEVVIKVEAEYKETLVEYVTEDAITASIVGNVII